MSELEAKLEQALKDYAASNETFDTEIASIRQQIADSEVTYSIGDRFKSGSGKKSIIATTYKGVGMLYLACGCLSAGIYEVDDSHKITQSELDQFMGEDKVRYWNHAKQCKC
jgi:restriction endonuclease S subunit